MTQKSANKKGMRYTLDAEAMFYKHASRYTEVGKILNKVFSKRGQPIVDGVSIIEDSKLSVN